MGCMARYFVQIVNTDSTNRLVLCEELYITDSKDEGNTLKPYLPEYCSLENGCA